MPISRIEHRLSCEMTVADLSGTRERCECLGSLRWATPVRSLRPRPPIDGRSDCSGTLVKTASGPRRHECTYPLTGLACVSRVYTDLAVFHISPSGVAVRVLFGVTFSELQELVDVQLVDETEAIGAA